MKKKKPDKYEIYFKVKEYIFKNKSVEQISKKYNIPVVLLKKFLKKLDAIKKEAKVKRVKNLK